MFGRGWARGEATIVTRRVIAQSHSGDGGLLETQFFEYIADVRASDGTSVFRATLSDPHNSIHFKAPEVGQVVGVLYDQGGRVKFDRSDADLHKDLTHRKADKAAVAAAHAPDQQSRWDAIAGAAPGSAAPAPAAARPTPAVTHAAEQQAQIREKTQALTAVTSRGRALLSEALAAKASGDGAALARVKAEMPAADAEVERLTAELQRLRADA